MTLAVIGLGGNLGNRPAHLRAAVRAVGCLGTVRGVSPVYGSPAADFTLQPAFLNTALALETRLHPLRLLRALKTIERSLGRSAGNPRPKGPRPVDLDILVYGWRPVSYPNLVIPHPALARRPFALVPLADLACRRHPARRALRRTGVILTPRADDRPAAVRLTSACRSGLCRLIDALAGDPAP